MHKNNEAYTGETRKLIVYSQYKMKKSMKPRLVKS